MTDRWACKLKVLLAGAVIASFGACTPSNTAPSASSGNQADDSGLSTGDTSMSLTVTSTAFASGEGIPVMYTGDGDDISPPLRWTGAPDGTREFALICDDPDAPSPQPWVHWVIYKIPGSVSALGENISKDETPTEPAGALQGRNSWGRIGYGGPAPPEGHGVHHYHFTVYALDTELDLSAGADKAALLEALEGHVLASGELVGTYER